MIKNLLDQDANQLDEIESESEKKIAAPPFATVSEPQRVKANEAENLSDISETAADAVPVSRETINLPPVKENNEPIAEAFDKQANRSALEFDSPVDSPAEETIENPNLPASNFNLSAETADETINFELPGDAKAVKSDREDREDADLLFQPLAEPDSLAETARKSGLAYAAAITLFASVVFMLIVGWFADLLFGSSPWGKVGGIVLGSFIGFIQLFRITSQIFKNKD